MRKVIIFVFLVSLFLVSCNDMGKAIYDGKDISGEASIIRDKNTKRGSLSSNINGEWKLYAGKSVDEIDFSKPLSGEGKGLFPLNSNDTVRNYYQLITSEGKAILSDRHLPMQGGYNFRDLGGIRNKEGKYIKWGKFFRADELGNLTPGDLAYLSGIPLITVIDFRTKEEINNLPDRLPESVKNYIELNITPGNLNAANVEDIDIKNMDGDSIMRAINKVFVTDKAIIALYKEFFKVLQEDSNIPLLFHCTAGKDRTGMAAALILAALGVEKEIIMKDYLLSNNYIKGKYENYIREYPSLEPLMEVRPAYLLTALDILDQQYGGIEKYLENVLEVNIQKFREIYLY